MRLSEIDLNLLVVFEAIHTEQNLTRAAEKLHLTQPAVSHALARLRGLLGDPLFERSGRHVAPTPLARTLIGPVREALATLERSLFTGESFDASRAARRFVVGMRAVLETVWLPALVERLRRDAPLLEVVSAPVVRRNLEADLASGAFDIAIEIALPVTSVIHHRRVAEDRLVVVARRGHPYASFAPPTLEAYLQAEHVLASSRRKGPGIEDVALAQQGHRRRVALRCQNYAAACRAAVRTDLLFTLPERLARSLDLEGALLAPFPIEMPPIGMHVYWHAAEDRDPANRWLRDQVEGLRHTLGSTRQVVGRTRSGSPPGRRG